jgi:hypothetical protein
MLRRNEITLSGLPGCLGYGYPVSYQYPAGGPVQRGGPAVGGQAPGGGPAVGGRQAMGGGGRRRGRRGRTVAGGVLALAGIALLASGVIVAQGSRSGSAAGSASAQPTLPASALAALQNSTSAWTQIPVVQLFPTTIVSANSDVTWVRLGVAAPASCSTALTSEWSSDPTNPCRVVLRATYINRSRDILATVALIVLPASVTAPSDEWTGLSGAAQAEDYPSSLQTVVQYPVKVTPVPGTLAAHWSDADIQAFNGASNNSFDFVSIVETGTMDGRDVGNLPAHWASERGAAYDQQGWVGPGDDLGTAYANYLFTISGGAAG